MVKKLKKMLTLVLVISMVMSLLSVTSFATGEEPLTPVTESDPYIYKLLEGSDGKSARWKNDLTRTGMFNSPYKAQFTVTYSNGAESGRQNWNISNGLFHLTRIDGVGEGYPAYCCDFIYSAVGGSKYRLLNLEESTYFSDDQAAKIRGIMNEGYWIDWEDDLDQRLKALKNDVNDWLEEDYFETHNVDITSEGAIAAARDLVKKVGDLDRGKALSATQLAIWNIANPAFGGVKYNIGADVQLHNEDTVWEINTIRDYLASREAEVLTRDDILFSNEGYFVAAEAIFSEMTDIENILYDLNVKIKLVADIQEGDELQLQAKLADRDIALYPLTGSRAITPDDNGYYTIEFKNVSEEEAQKGIHLSISGTQAVEGIYFFQAEAVGRESVRESSQNMVSRYSGNVPVYAETTLDVDLGTTDISLMKYNGSAEGIIPEGTDVPAGMILVDNCYYPALEGVTFDLYAQVKEGRNTIDLLLKEDLVTDENGMIIISGLPENYDYYFKETSGLDGYIVDYDDIHMIKWPSGVVTVENCYDLGDLQISKNVEGVPTDQHFEFSIELDLDEAALEHAADLVGTTFKANWKNLKDECLVPECEDHPDEIAFAEDHGLYKANVRIRNEEVLVINNLPADTPYRITELGGDNLDYAPSNGDDSIHVTYTPDEDTVEGWIVGEDVEKVEFNNAAYVETEIALEAMKTVDGDIPGDETFLFELTEWDSELGDWSDYSLEIAENDGEGRIEFDSITYDSLEDGRTAEYKYRITEIPGNGPFVYDRDEKYAVVTVSSDEGVLNAEVEYFEEYNRGRVSGALGPEEVPAFHNEAYAEDSVYLDGTKYLDDKESATGFTFILTDITDLEHPEYIEDVKNDENGYFRFSPLSYTEEGTYTYMVEEAANSKYTCDTAIYTIVVEVEQDNVTNSIVAGEPQITRVVTEGEQPEAVEAMEFYNYSKKSGRTAATWKFSVNKTMDGEPAEGFYFEMIDEDGAVKKARSDKSGVAAFSSEIYRSAGTYEYTVKEVIGDDEAIEYDASEYLVTVTVRRTSKAYEIEDVTIEEIGAEEEGNIEEITFENKAKDDDDDDDDKDKKDEEKDDDNDGGTGDHSGGGGSGDEFEIFDEEVPLANVPKTGDSSILWIAMALMSGLALLILNLRERKKA